MDMTQHHDVEALQKRIHELEAALSKYIDISVLGPDENGDYDAPIQRFYAKEVLTQK